MALAFDVIAHFEVFVNPNSATAALALLFIPLSNIFIIVPSAIILMHVLLRKKNDSAKIPSNLVAADASSSAVPPSRDAEQ